nr:hypothetical protein [Tanacetum cinerariifolium]
MVVVNHVMATIVTRVRAHVSDVHPPSQEISDEVFQANHSIQNKESLENSSDEISASNPNQEKEEPPQDSKICQLIREECSVKVCEEQKQSMEDTMLELVKICQEKEFLCIHDNVEDLIESALNSKLLSSNSNYQGLEKEQQEVKNIAEQPAERGNHITPILSTEEPEHLLSMGYEHLSITPETKSNEVTESNAENLLPILSECEVTLEDKRECDLPIFENIPVCDNSDTFSDSKIDDDISVYDDDFEDIEYVEASLSYLEIDNVEEENVVQQEEEEFDLEDISQIQDVVLREKLFSITRLITNIESLNDNPTPNHDNPSIPRPPPKPPDAETDAGEEIPVVMTVKDKFDEDYHISCLISCFLYSPQRVRIRSLIMAGFTPSD